MIVDPFRPVKLGGTLALATVLAGGVAPLPPGNLADGLRTIAGFVSVGLSTKVTCDTLADDAKAEETALETEVQAAITTDLYRANAAYYREFPHHWKARKPVPDEWLQLWGQTGGKPYLALHPAQQHQAIAQPQTQPIQAQGQTRGGSFDVADGFIPQHPQAPPSPPTFSQPIASTAPAAYQPDLFDWASFQKYPDRYPHVCCVGASGDGKTTLQEFIARLIAHGNELVILTTKRKSDQWVGLEPIGLGRNFAPVATKWHELDTELNNRCLDLDHAQTLPQCIIAVDELNDLVANAGVNLAAIARAGREPRVRLVVNSHTAGVDGLGLRGQHELKACFTWVRLGSFALQYAQTLANKGLLNQSDLEWLKKQQRPCMVDDSLAQVPDLGLGWQARLYGSPPPPPSQPQPNAEPQTPPSFELDSHPVVQGSGSVVHEPEPAQIMPPPPHEPPTDREAELLAKFSEFKRLGMNQKQIIYALWQAKKGGGNPYKMAKEFYDRLNTKYLEINGDNAA